MTIFLVFVLPTIANAQQSRHEISLGGGPSIIVFGEFMGFGTVKPDYIHHNFTKCVTSLRYDYNINKHISVGCMLRFNRETEQLKQNAKERLQEINDKISHYENWNNGSISQPSFDSHDITEWERYNDYRNNLTERDAINSITTGRKNVRLGILPTIRVYWFNKEHFGMYSKAAAGVLLTIGDNCSRQKKRAHFAFYGAPIGIEGGNNFIRGYLELSLGFEAGIKINIPHKKNKSVGVL